MPFILVIVIVIVNYPTLLTRSSAVTNLRDAFSGQSRSPNIVAYHSICYIACSLLLCNSNFVFKRRRFYDVRLQKKCRDVEIGVRSLEVIESGTIRKIVYGFLFSY